MWGCRRRRRGRRDSGTSESSPCNSERGSSMRGRRRYIVGSWMAVGVIILAATAARTRSQEPDLDVLKVLPQNYKLVLDNPMVRVIEAHIPAGTAEPRHRHLRGVSVAMGDYLIEHRDESG